LTCTGAAAADCKTCDATADLWLRKDLSECVDDCGDDRYKEANTQTCEKCHSTCGCCDAATSTDCTCCNEGDFLKDDGSCGDCDVGYYGNLDT